MKAIHRQLDRFKDPRYYQIGVLTSLVCFGVGALDFGIHWQNALTIVATALAVQFLGTLYAQLPRFDPLSPLITALSLTLLLRTDEVALVTLMLASDQAWVSSGQWGSAAIGAFTLACLGFLVLTRARRAETTIAFLLIYASLLFGRAAWLGDPLAIPLHQLQNGALLIFAFFMISDPKTTPNSAAGRVLFAAVVAAIAFIIQFIYYEPNGPILALIISAPTVPLIDTLMRGRIYQWARPAARAENQIKGVY